MGKVSGPIMDRIDLWVELQSVELSGLQSGYPAESTAVIRKRVERARKLQEMRFEGSDYRFNADIRAGDLEKYCPLGETERKLMEQLYSGLQLSARGYHRIMRVARTIADLEGSEKICQEHLLEAAGYRPGEVPLH